MKVLVHISIDTKKHATNKTNIKEAVNLNRTHQSR